MKELYEPAVDIEINQIAGEAEADYDRYLQRLSMEAFGLRRDAGIDSTTQPVTVAGVLVSGVRDQYVTVTSERDNMVAALYREPLDGQHAGLAFVDGVLWELYADKATQVESGLEGARKAALLAAIVHIGRQERNVKG